MLWTCVSAALTVLFSAIPLLAKDPVLLATVGVNYGAGFIDKTGVPVPGLTGFAAIRQDGKWGFMATDGKIVIKPQFEEVGDFFVLD